MLIQQTDKWRSSPPIMTDAAIGLVRRPASLLADVPDHLGQWAIAHGYAIAYEDGEDLSAQSDDAPPADTAPDESAMALVLEFLNGADQEQIAAVRGITEATAAKVVKARPLGLAGLATALTAKQIQSLEQYVAGES